MKRTSRQTKKLNLHPETIRVLEEKVLERVGGGQHGTDQSCPTGHIPSGDSCYC